MVTKRKFKSDAFEAIHSAVEGMLAAGTIDKETMRTFDEDCLVIPQELSPGEIKALREDNHVSQPVFARYLNTSQSTVQTGQRSSSFRSCKSTGCKCLRSQTNRPAPKISRRILVALMGEGIGLKC